LKLKHDKQLSSFALNSNLGRYTVVVNGVVALTFDTNAKRPGRVVQVDPIQTTLKAPGTKRLKLRCVEVLSSFAFKFNLRRYCLA